MKLLYINTYDPFVERHGGAVVSRSELNALREVFDVDTLFGSPLSLRKKEIDYGQLLLDLVAGRSLKYSSYNVLRRPPEFYRCYDLIWCSHDFSAYDHCVFVRLGIPFVVRKHNAEHRFLDGRRGLHRYERNRIFAFERQIGAAAKATFHISSTECIADDYSHRKVYLPPLMGGEIIASGSASASAYAFAERNIDLLCVSNFEWAPNKEGIEWFIKCVMPLLPNNVTMHLVGVGSECYGRSDRIIGHGFAPDLHSYYGAAKVFLSPVLSGAGVKIKTVSALAAGLPVVSTSVGVEGMQSPVDCGSALVADSAEEFADHIKQLLQKESLCCEMSDRAFQWANENVITPASWIQTVKQTIREFKN